MECRLDLCREGDRPTVRIHGRLAGAAVGELERMCGETGRSAILDVTYLMSADDRGVATLRRLQVEGAELVGISPYLALLLGVDRC